MSLSVRGLLSVVSLSFLLGWTSLLHAQRKHAAEEKGIRSINANEKAAMRFMNQSGRTTKVYWLDYQGNRKHYKTLRDREAYDQQTFLAHPWLITDENDNAWYVYFPDGQPRTVEIVAPRN